MAAALALALGAWASGLVWFATSIPLFVEDEQTKTDVIVVLTGGTVRVKTGVDLLRGGAAESLFVSGVHEGVDLAELAHSIHDSPSDIEGRITLGYAADDTAGNAAETAAWMRSRGYASLRLVTAAYHMRRSLLEFRRLMPAARIIPHPVFPHAFKQADWWRWPGTAALIASEYNKYLLALVRHFLAAPTPPWETRRR
ncbi:MAG: YdcF family protein [Alphaproteobacteria bacterium]|nr:YdcF family protein [Alphaproteobacteria bacterium]